MDVAQHLGLGVVRIEDRVLEVARGARQPLREGTCLARGRDRIGSEVGA